MIPYQKLHSYSRFFIYLTVIDCMKKRVKIKNDFTPWCIGSDCSLTKHSINERTMAVARRCLAIIYIMYLVRVSCFFLVYLLIYPFTWLHNSYNNSFFQPVKSMTIKFQWSLNSNQTCLCRLQWSQSGFFADQRDLHFLGIIVLTSSDNFRARQIVLYNDVIIHH